MVFWKHLEKLRAPAIASEPRLTQNFRPSVKGWGMVACVRAVAVPPSDRGPPVPLAQPGGPAISVPGIEAAALNEHQFFKSTSTRMICPH